MSKRLRFLASSCLPILSFAGVAYAADVNVGGAILWTDSEDKTHPVRGVKWEIVSTVAGVDTVRASGNANDDGVYAATFVADPAMPNAFLRVYSDTVAAYVAPSQAIAVADTYKVDGSNFNALGGNVLNGFAIPRTTTAGQSFSVLDAITTGRKYLITARAGGALPKLPTRFPHASPPLPNTSFYQANKIYILQEDRWDWDVMGHEFSHYAHDVDKLTDSPGDTHAFGVSNIPARGKGDGIKLAWGEGVGTYMGVAQQFVDTTGPANLKNYGDTFYTDTEDSTNNVDLEGAAGSGVAGEGDETAVMRVLWDIADPKNDDRVERTHAQLYKDLVAARDRVGAGAKLASLSQVNDYYMNGLLTKDADRVDYGAIYEAQGISPHPKGAIINSTVDLTGEVKFEWDRKNDSRNDTFQIIVWSDDFLTRIIDAFTVPGNVETYSLTAAQKLLLKPYEDRDLNFSILGSDLKTPAGGDYAGIEATGAFWSDYYTFSVLPEPTSVAAIMAVFGLVAARRRA
jgi:hypothetical protein